MKTVFYTVLALYLLAIALFLWTLWYDRERVLRGLRKTWNGAIDLLEGQSPREDAEEAKKAFRGLSDTSWRTAVALQRIARSLNRIGIQVGWLAADPPRWDWPRFSPSPNRPWDWKVDGDH